jgi:cupin superfamily acireductone dioxygenase involved in methionine salvage
MQHYTIDDISRQRGQTSQPYHEFLRVPSMSAGLYELPAWGVDGQLPHSEDELYYVVAGRAKIRVADEEAPVAAGSLVFVAAHVEHRFFDITEDLRVLVFFAPAEYSQAKG